MHRHQMRIQRTEDKVSIRGCSLATTTKWLLYRQCYSRDKNSVNHKEMEGKTYIMLLLKSRYINLKFRPTLTIEMQPGLMFDNEACVSNFWIQEKQRLSKVLLKAQEH